MHEKMQIEKVLSVFSEYIDSVPEIDIAYTRKGRYLYLLDGAEDQEIESDEWLCNRLMSEIEFDVQRELQLDGESIPKEQLPILYARMQQYLDKLPEYQYLLENYKQ